MTTKRMAVAAAVILVLLVAAYLWGYWPERQRRIDAEQTAVEAEGRLGTLDARVRAARLLGELLHVSDAAAALNYGVAQELSSAFFDAAREEADRAPDAAIRTALQDLAARRDAVMTALARADPRVVETLREMEVDYRAALGYPTGFQPAPPAAPVATPLTP